MVSLPGSPPFIDQIQKTSPVNPEYRLQPYRIQNRRLSLNKELICLVCFLTSTGLYNFPCNYFNKRTHILHVASCVKLLFRKITLCAKNVNVCYKEVLNV